MFKYLKFFKIVVIPQSETLTSFTLLCMYRRLQVKVGEEKQTKKKRKSSLISFFKIRTQKKIFPKRFSRNFFSFLLLFFVVVVLCQPTYYIISHAKLKQSQKINKKKNNNNKSKKYFWHASSSFFFLNKIYSKSEKKR